MLLYDEPAGFTTTKNIELPIQVNAHLIKDGRSFDSYAFSEILHY